MIELHARRARIEANSAALEALLGQVHALTERIAELERFQSSIGQGCPVGARLLRDG